MSDINPAFDYAKQKWVEGREALLVQHQQLVELLETLNDKRKGDEYARFINAPSREYMLTEAQQEMKFVERLMRELHVERCMVNAAASDEATKIVPFTDGGAP